MPFQRGNQLGNRHGRPKKGDSLADLIRAEGNKEQRKQKMARKMWGLAADPHDRADIAIKAADWIAKHGYGVLADLGDGDTLPPTRVVIELHRE